MKSKKSIEESGKKLQEIGSFLKSKYRGIDKPIDEIIKSIEIWYTLDDLLYKPTIICLWGMSSVGKTSLVHDLVKLLDMYEKFVDIDMSKTASRTVTFSFSNSTIENALYNRFKDPSEKGILLLDEFHKINNTSSYGDVWKLLSDGKISSNHMNLYRIDSAISLMESQIEEYVDTAVELGAMKVASGDTSNDDVMEGRWNPINHPIPMSKRYIIDRFLDVIEIESFDQLSPIFDFHEFSGVYTKYPFGIRNVVRTNYENHKMSVKDILYSPGFTFIHPLIQILKNHRKLLVERYSKVTGKDTTIFSKLLIFITGNLDGLYTDCKNTDIDADELHNKTLNLKIGDLRKELLKLFKPEEVSRLGSNHIIYPSLDKKAFIDIIKDKLIQIENDIKEISLIELKLVEDKYIDHLYKVGMVASQGARPVISQVYTEINKHVPELIKYAIINDKKNISITDLKKVTGKSF